MNGRSRFRNGLKACQRLLTTAREVPVIPPKLCPPRRRCAASTREALLLAARARFLGESYENVGMRNIAADVGVDVALVSRYFGSKEDLFRAVLGSFGDSPFQVDVTAAELPVYLVGLLCDGAQPATTAKVERLLIILRSASSPAAAAIIRESVHADVLDPIARLLDGDQAPLRASLMLAVLMGTTILRTIMAVEPLQQCGGEKVRARLQRLFEAALSPD